MNTYKSKYSFKQILQITTIIITVFPTFEVSAEVSTDTNTDFALNPIHLVEGANVPPRVMINLSNDHHLYYKAYTDYSDIDGDGEIETTYKHSIDYTGYFDSYKCYSYNSPNQRFEPSNITADKYCNGTWSGNFLNWATMSRIDIIRKLLYGGSRRVDTATETVLERTYLPNDTHSWAKYYDGSDIPKLTPFSIQNGDYDCDRNNFITTPACFIDQRRIGITIGNTTDVNSSSAKFSQEVTDPPLIKVVKGNYSLWASGDTWQVTWRPGGTVASPNDEHNGPNNNVPANSGIQAYSDSPYWDNTVGENHVAKVGEGNYVARVQVCVAGLEGNEQCKRYPNGNLKPVGLLQVYGDDDNMFFGMVAGSYTRHASGGELIRNVGSITDEVAVSSDGTFPNVAAFAGGPRANDQATGMINALSLYRITGYDTDTGRYDTGGNGSDNCQDTFQSVSDLTADDQCQNWGNPFSELYYQSLHYLAGNPVIADYHDNSSGPIPGLHAPETVIDPLDEDSRCAPLFVVNFNSGSPSYDADELDATDYEPSTLWDENDLPNGAITTSAQLTDIIGSAEGVEGNNFIFGYTDLEQETGDGVCTPKTLTSLGQTGGLCPDAGRLLGSYRIAGLAYFAHIADLRPDSAPNRSIDGMQNVDTYSLNMAASSPILEIPHPLHPEDTAATIIPACRDQRDSPNGNCTLVGYKILSQTIDSETGTGSGKIFVSWEVGDAGGDFDQDMWGTISYLIDLTDDNTPTLAVTTQVMSQSTSGIMGLGYILNGTKSDTFHAHSGVNNFTFAETADQESPDCTEDGCIATDAASTKTYALEENSTPLLKDPLWYASKWGSFVDSNGNNIPDVTEEWDQEINATGQAGSDGIPDTYFSSNNPTQLGGALTRLLDKIVLRVSSGTGAAVATNNIRGDGLIYQAFYQPSIIDTDGITEATWVGTIRSLWIDNSGLLREDGDGDGQLDDYQTDRVLETFYDNVQSRTRVRVWDSSDPDTFTQSTSSIIELNEVNSVWDAEKSLSALVAPGSTVAIETQRSYNHPFQDSGRHIFTWLDNDDDGVVDAGETKPFIAATFHTDFSYLNVADSASAGSLVNFIRGDETQAGMRNRTINQGSLVSPDPVTHLLGDIIHSTPTVVSAPQEAMHLLYKDASYAEFLVQYQNRRTVIYAGANDGMLHAFNGGFINSANEVSVNGTQIDNQPATAHELGAELWAYVPQNLLPHLKWLSHPGYQHVYYVDGKPRVVDAKIFEADATHPNGWGTVLVVGMRFGGGPITVDINADGLGGDNEADDRTFSSAYIIMDITNPEEEPTLLAEISLPDDSYTTVYPTFFKIKDLDPGSDPNQWYLMFGSGPNDRITAESSSTAKVYIVNPLQMTSVGVSTPLHALTDTGSDSIADCTVDTSTGFDILVCDTKQPNTFLGDPVAVDWELDYRDDALYFGTVGDDTSTVGSFYRLALDGEEDSNSWREPVVLYDAARPISAGATLAIDNLNNHWVYFGTGRDWSQRDLISTAAQSLLGMKDYYNPANGLPQQLVNGNLLDVTDIKIVNFMRGNVTNFTDNETSMSVTALQGTAGDGPYQSWKIDNFTTGESGTSNSPRTLGAIGSSINFRFEPSTVADTTSEDILVWTTNGKLINPPPGYQTFDLLETAIDDGIWDGWLITLAPISGTAGVDPATRSTTQSALTGGTLFTSVYQPSIVPCEPEGLSQLYGVYYKTGTAHPDRLPLGLHYDSNIDRLSETHTDLGRGFAAAPSIHSGGGPGHKKISVFTQLSTSELEEEDGGVVHNTRSGWLSWRAN